MSMLYKALLHLHNLIWWIVLLSGLWAIFRGWRGKLAGAAWTRHDRIAGLVFSSALATHSYRLSAFIFQSPFVHRCLPAGRREAND